jgi:glycosyltransferase involved in cell wall biosynthesis
VRVLHLSTARSWRGGEQQLLSLAEGLGRRGQETLVLAPPAAPLLERCAAAGVPAEAFPARGGLDPAAMWRLGRRLREWNADLVHAHDAHGVSLAAVGGWLGGARRVCTRRVDFPLRGRWKYRRGMERVICISEAIRQVCRRAGVEAARLPVVHSGVDPDRLRGEHRTRRLRESLGLPREADILLNVAALVDHKDQATLLEALHYIGLESGRVHLLLAGEGELKAPLQRLARELAVEERAHFLGFREDVGALLALGDLFVMSSHLEGLCTSVLDAMAMERACVVTDAGGLPEIVADGETGTVVPARDPERFAAAVLALLADRKRRLRMGRAGRRRVLDHFTVDRMVEGTLAVYRELTGA